MPIKRKRQEERLEDRANDGTRILKLDLETGSTWVQVIMSFGKHISDL